MNQIVLLLLTAISWSCRKNCHWSKKYCPATKQSTACQTGINNHLCEASLLEERRWTQSFNDASTFFHFTPPNAREEYLVMKVPIASKAIVEKRTGTLAFSTDGKTLSLTTTSSTCSGDSSFLTVLDESPRSVTVIRNDTVLALDLSPPEIVSGKGNYKSALEAAVGHFEATVVNAILAPFTEAFWVDIVTGQLSFSTDTASAMSTAVASGTLGCISVSGIKK